MHRYTPTPLPVRLAVAVGFAAVAVLGFHPPADAVPAPPVMPRTWPEQGRPQFDSGAVHAIAPAGASTYVGGDVTPRLVRTEDAGATWSADPGAPVWALLRYGPGVVVGTTEGVAHYRPPSTTPTWTRPLAGRVSSLERIRDTHYVVVAGTLPRNALRVLDMRTGLPVPGYRLPAVTGRVSDNSGRTRIYRADMHPTGGRYIAVGNFTAVGGQDRRQAVMLHFNAVRAAVVAWDSPAFHASCSPKQPAYLNDAEWYPRGGRVAFVSTGGSVGPLCDSLFVMDGEAVGTGQRVLAQNFTCVDTLESVEVSADGRTIFAGGHQKCVEKRAGGPRDYVPRHGFAAYNADTLDARGWRSDNCRGIGATETTYNRVTETLWVGYNCGTWQGESGEQEPMGRLAGLPRRD